MSLVTSSLMQPAAEAELVFVAVLGLVQMGADGHYHALALQVLDYDDGGPYTGVVHDLLPVQQDVHIASHQDLFVLELVVREVLKCLLGLGPVKKALHTVGFMIF